MQNKQLPPFNRGDEVIDDNAEIGYVLENYIDATWDAAGNLTNWHTRIHYRWDQPSYGLTRVVSEGEISLLTQRAPDAPKPFVNHCNPVNGVHAPFCNGDHSARG